MRILLSVLVLGSCCLLVRGFGYPEILGKGQWTVLNVQECDDPEQYEFQIQFPRRKLNRTHDCFNLHFKIDKEINSTYGFEVEVYQEVDGGFKFNQRVIDDDFCKFVPKYGGENFHRLLKGANIEPADCPIPAGDYYVNDFLLDYTELSDTALYGTFETYLYVTYNGRKMCCMRWLVRFEKCDDEDDDK